MFVDFCLSNTCAFYKKRHCEIKVYLKIIRGKQIDQVDNDKALKTKVSIDKPSVSFGAFKMIEEQKAAFHIENLGNNLLVIQDVNTSCGCTSVEYSKEPVQPGMGLDLHVIYKADHPEHFTKTITVYCNAESSPIKLTISGNAE